MLSIKENGRFQELEMVIENGLQTFYDVGAALIEIKNNPQWWDAQYGTWENYLRKRWDISKSYESRLVSATQFVDRIKTELPIGNNILINEYQIRPILTLPQEKQVEAWQKAVESVPEGERLTHRHVKAVVKELTQDDSEEDDPDPEPAPEPESFTVMQEFKEWVVYAGQKLTTLAFRMTQPERERVADVLEYWAMRVRQITDDEAIS